MISSAIGLATAAAALFISGAQAQAAGSYQGCVGVSNTFEDTVPLTPNGPEACAKYCTAEGYPYIALSAQFCSCSKTAPVVTEKYADSACSFTCDAPEESQTCGGMDPDTFEFIYSLWLYGDGAPVQAPSNGATTQPAVAATTAGPIASSPLAESSARVNTNSVLSAPVIDGSTSGLPSGVGPVETSPTAPIVPVATDAGNGSADAALVSGSAEDPAASPFTTVTDSLFVTSTVPCVSSAFTQIVVVTTTVPCSDGTMETAVAEVPTVIYYDPAYSTVRTVIDSTTTRYVLVAITGFITETATAVNTPANNTNGIATATDGTGFATVTDDPTSPTFAVVVAGADKTTGGLSILGFIIAALAGLALS